MFTRGPIEEFLAQPPQEHFIRRHGFFALAGNRPNTPVRQGFAEGNQQALWDNIDTGRGASLGDMQSTPIHVGSSSESEVELLESAITDSVIDDYFQ